MLKTILTPFYLARRNMRSRRDRTFLTLLGIILGVAVVLAIQLTNQTTLDSLRQVFDRTTGQANLLIVPINENEGYIEQDLYAKVEKTPGIQIAAPSVRVSTLLASEADSWQVSFSMIGIAEGSYFQLYGIDPELDPEVRIYILKAGRMPQLEKYEVIIPAKLATKENLEIGDNLVVLTSNGNEQLKIVGLLDDEGVALLNDGKVGFTSLEVTQDLFQRSGELDEIAFRTELEIGEDPSALEELKKSLSARVGKEAVVIYPASRGELVGQMLATYQLGLTFFSLIAIFVGAFLIYNAFSMNVAERTREIGMLRAVGMSRFQIIRMVLAEAVQLSLIGSILGMGAGCWLARGLIKLLGDLVTSQQAAISVTWQSLLLSLGVGIVVTLIAAVIPAIQAANISPIEALRVRGRSSEIVRPNIWISGLVMLLLGRYPDSHLGFALVGKPNPTSSFTFL
jgi:putative ABC transport system permease protein